MSESIRVTILVDAVLDRGIDILLSESTFGELASRLDRPEFDPYRERESWNVFLCELAELALWHEDAGTATGTSRAGCDWTGRCDSGDGDPYGSCRKK